MNTKIISNEVNIFDRYLGRSVREIFDAEYNSLFIGGYKGLDIRHCINMAKYLHILATQDFFDQLFIRSDLDAILNKIDIIQDDAPAQQFVRRYLTELIAEFTKKTSCEQGCFKMALMFHDIGYIIDPTTTHADASITIVRELFSSHFSKKILKKIIDIIASHSILSGIGVSPKSILIAAYNLEISRFDRILIETLDSAKVFEKEGQFFTSIKLAPEIIDVFVHANIELFQNDPALYQMKIRSVFSSVHFGQLMDKDVNFVIEQLDITLQQRGLCRDAFIDFINNYFKIDPFFLPKDLLVDVIDVGQTRFYPVSKENTVYFAVFLSNLFCHYNKISKNSESFVGFKLRALSDYFKWNPEERMKFRGEMFVDIQRLLPHAFNEKYFQLGVPQSDRLLDTVTFKT